MSDGHVISFHLKEILEAFNAPIKFDQGQGSANAYLIFEISFIISVIHSPVFPTVVEFGVFCAIFSLDFLCRTLSKLGH